MFAPLYLSNYCVNGCVYCPYHHQNKHIARKKLTQEEIKKEVIALQDMGHKRLALEAGEDPVNNPIEYPPSKSEGSTSSAGLILGTLMVCGPTPCTASRCSACMRRPASS